LVIGGFYIRLYGEDGLYTYEEIFREVSPGENQNIILTKDYPGEYI